MSTSAEKSSGVGQGVGFIHYRRITGYLVGGVDKWNNAKQAELSDRVKHDVSAFLDAEE